jgi:hypothetical protein
MILHLGFTPSGLIIFPPPSNGGFVSFQGNPSWSISQSNLDSTRVTAVYPMLSLKHLPLDSGLNIQSSLGLHLVSHVLIGIRTLD